MVAKIRAHLKKVRRIRHLRAKLAIAFFHAIFLVCLSVLLQYVGNVRIEETAFFKMFAICKHNILHIDPKPLGDSVVFLDVSKDLQLVSDTGSNYGHVAITDRKCLADFFTELNKHPNGYKLVVCDLGFDHSSDDDPLLKPQIEKAENVFIAATWKNGRLLSPPFNCPYGATAYLVNSGSFVKMPLFYNDTVRSLPLVVAEHFSHKKFTYEHGLVYVNGKFTFNTIIPEFFYRKEGLVPENLESSTVGYPNFHRLGEMMALPNYFDRFLKNKYLLIGDAADDTHNTYLGTLPGTVVVLDTFLTIKTKNLAVPLAWFALLFLTFFGISYCMFVLPVVDTEKLEKNIRISFIREFAVKYFSYLGILIVLNVISYSMFGIFISLFYVGTYLTFIHSLIKKLASVVNHKSFIYFFTE